MKESSSVNLGRSKISTPCTEILPSDPKQLVKIAPAGKRGGSKDSHTTKRSQTGPKTPTPANKSKEQQNVATLKKRPELPQKQPHSKKQLSASDLTLKIEKMNNLPQSSSPKPASKEPAVRAQPAPARPTGRKSRAKAQQPQGQHSKVSISSTSATQKVREDDKEGTIKTVKVVLPDLVAAEV